MKNEAPKLGSGTWHTVSSWPYSLPTAGQLRKFIFDAERNGFNRCFKRVGQGAKKRIWLNEEAVFEWIDENLVQS